jgi:hypothetical protein
MNMRFMLGLISFFLRYFSTLDSFVMVMMNISSNSTNFITTSYDLTKKIISHNNADCFTTELVMHGCVRVRDSLPGRLGLLH